MKRVLLAAAVAALSFVVQAIDSDAYVQRGLVAQWDGIQNTAAGHDANATEWTDLTGNGHTLGNFASGVSWADDGLVMPSAAYKLAASFSGTPVGLSDYKSYEIIFAKGDDTAAATFVFGFGKFKGLALYKSASNRGFKGDNSGPLFEADYDYSGELQHLYMEYDDSDKSSAAYYNGEALTPMTKTDSWKNSDSGLGYSGSTSYPLHGRICAIRLYGRRLTDGERLANYRIDQRRYFGVTPEKDVELTGVEVDARTPFSLRIFAVVANLGDEPCTAELHYGTSAEALDGVIGLGSCAGGFASTPSTTLTGLTPVTDYFVQVVLKRGEEVLATSEIQRFSTTRAVYVSSKGDDTTGDSWEHAYTTFTGAIANAEDDDTIILDDETFPLATSKSLTIAPRVTITSRTSKELSIIDGENKGYITLSASGACIHDVTLTRTGEAYSGTCAISITDGGIVSNCVFRQCGNGLAGSGNCRYMINSLVSGRIYGCVVTNCSPPNSPAFNVAGSTLVENCFIADNTHRGASVSSYPGIGIVATGSAVIRNCTIVNNTCKNVSAAAPGIYVKSADVTVENCIVWGNTWGTDSKTTYDWYSTGATTKWCNNCTSGAENLQGPGNTSEDPLLAEDSLHFLSTSPCRGKANANAPKYDIFGVERPVPASIGAAEYVEGEELVCKISVDKTVVYAPETITLTVTLDGKSAGPLVYAWDFDGDGKTDSSAESPALSALGVYKPSVVVTDAGGKAAQDAYAGELFVYHPDKIVYVDAASTTAKAPYMTRETAATNVDEAVRVAPEGSKMLFKKGRYVSTGITLGKKVDLIGEGDREDAVIDFNNKERRLVVSVADVQIANLTLEKGTDMYTAGTLLAIGAAATVSNCVFRNSHVSNGGNSRYAVYCSAQGVKILNCEFSDISLPGAYGIGTSTGGGVIVENCLFHGCEHANKASDTPGGALNGYGCYRNCTVVSNRTVRADYCSPVCDEKPLEIVNCVFAENTVLTGDGTYAPSNDVTHVGAAKVRNCLVYPSDLDYSGYMSVKVEDPLFSSKKTYRLSAVSPCVNAGDTTVALSGALDLDGRRRVANRRIDLGCYESQVGGTVIIVR